MKVEVRPAELMEGGMVIFTKDQNLRPESPSLSNGWNTVLYKLDTFARLNWRFSTRPDKRMTGAILCCATVSDLFQ